MKSIFHLNTINYTALALFLVVTLISCQDKKAETTEADAKQEEPGATGILTLTTAQMEAVGITIGKLEKKNLSAVVKANGQLAVPPQNKADVSVLSGGIIKRINVLEGQQVSHGQVLAMVENQELIRIQQDYLLARNNFTYVQAEYTRQQQLRDADAGTGKTFQSAQATYHAEMSRIKAFESQLKQLGIAPRKISGGSIVSQFPLRSPIGGTVGQITANTGAFVQPGTSVMVVVDNSKIHCDLIVFEKDLMKVKNGQPVNFMLTNQESQWITGKINGINKSFENGSKGVVVHAVINNPAHQNLIPGMYVTALIDVGNAFTPAVPTDAIIRSEGKEYVFVVAGKKADHGDLGVSFKKTEVKTGVTELGFTQVTPLEKLPDGVEIAIKGAFYLQSKSTGDAEEE